MVAVRNCKIFIFFVSGVQGATYDTNKLRAILELGVLNMFLIFVLYIVWVWNW